MSAGLLRDQWGPASWVTLARATLAVGVAALVVDSFAHDTPVGLLVTLAAVALALDLVDGWLARRTGTATALGARFDGEVDAFLILALSVYAAPAYGAWVLAIGAARYLFGAGEWLVPWMRAPLPPRRWRKVVAATQGVVLTIAAAGVLPRALMQALLGVALVLLAASMGECTWWLWRGRHAARAVARPAPRARRLRPISQEDRAHFDRALHRARVSAYAPGEFVGQESFMTAGEIRALGVQAGIGPGVTVLDLCCGVAGPGRFLTRELGCAYLGVDASASAAAVARTRAGEQPCRFAVAQVPPVPSGPFDVVLLLETMLAFADKTTLVDEIGATLRPGGRFAFTLEEGPPLTAPERAAMPNAHTVWLDPLDAVAASLERAGLVVTCVEDHSPAHRATAQALADAFAADAEAIGAQIGRRALDELVSAHRLWAEWLDAGRVRKLAVVAERA
jgi:phosphatidylglycerophosphate synthase/SAM-dependent methyltransferase